MTRFDLHIHSSLSACAENGMSPRRILKRARDAGLGLIAVTDHNASAQVGLCCRLAPEYGVSVIPGMEVSSREEVHVLAYFPGLSELAEFQAVVDRSLPELENNSDFFGWQLLYDEHGEIVDLDQRLRQVGTTLPLAGLVEMIHKLQGKAVPAHVFRHRYSLTSQLGFIDPDGGFDALEISRKEWVRRGLKLGDWEGETALLSGSDSHFLEDIGRFSLEMEAAAGDIEELAEALF